MMDKYLFYDILYYLKPFIVVIVSVLTGVLISNAFWKGRIYRYSKSEIQQTLAFQSKKIEYQKNEIKKKDKDISLLKSKVIFSREKAIQIVSSLSE